MLALALAAGCGVRRDDGPRALGQDVPPDLLRTTTTDGSDQRPSPPPPRGNAAIYLVDVENERLERVERSLQRPVSVSDVLHALLERGATDEELEDGLSSSIPADTTVRDVDRLEDGVVVLNLSNDLFDTARQGLRLALAQLVYTATESERIDKVLFEVDGEPREVPDDEGGLSAEPVTRGDFADYKPRATT